MTAKRNRTVQEIWLQILQTLDSNEIDKPSNRDHSTIFVSNYNKRTKSGLIYSVQLAPRQAKQRLKELEGAGLIYYKELKWQKNKNMIEYHITPRGKEFLELLEKQKKIIKL